MKNHSFSAAVIGLFLIPLFSFAAGGGSGGGLVGNGGGSVSSSAGGPSYVLDLIEREDLTPVTINPNQQYDSWLFSGLCLESPLLRVLGLYPNFYASFWDAIGNRDVGFRYCAPDQVLGRNFVQKTFLEPLKFYFTKSELVSVPDEGKMDLEGDFEKQQVAIQKDGRVLISENKFDRLDDTNKTSLLLHEYVLYVVLNHNPKLISEQGTAPVRKFVRRTVAYLNGRTNGKRVDIEWVEQALKELGI